jgi:3-phosphoshikimate 1-carboxyvinyltransferase
MSAKSFNLIINNKISSFKKTISVDSDKSLSIRSFLIGAISHNISSAKNILESQDVLSAIKCLKRLGVKIKKKGSKNYLIYGKGVGSLIAKKNTVLNFGNSGTLARLLIGILSTTPNTEVKITGDHSLNKRSMKKLINLMTQFGAFFLPKNKFKFPLKMISSKIPIAINYEAGVSAQLKSAVIFAALNSYGNTKIFEKERSRDHTENLLHGNAQVIKIKNKKKKLIEIIGRKYLNPIKVNIPGDPSSAAFFAAVTLLNKKSSC